MMATLNQEPDLDVSSELTVAVICGLWKIVLMLLRSDDCKCNRLQRHWAIKRIVLRAPDRFVEENLDDICELSAGDKPDIILSHLISRRLWGCVGRGLGGLLRDISHTQRREAVEEASRHLVDDDFVQYILPHCFDEELESVLTRLVAKGRWTSVCKVLERDISPTQRSWAVEEASRYADEEEFAHILHHCTEEGLEPVLTNMVLQGLWEPVTDNVTEGDNDLTQRVLLQLILNGRWEAVGRFLQRDISCAVHSWAVKQASMHADDGDFYVHISHCCFDEELESALTHLVSRGLWISVDDVLERGVNPTQRSWAVEQASTDADEEQFADYILPHCTEEELQQVLTNMVVRGLWEPVTDNATEGNIDLAQHVLSQLMSHHLWPAVGRFLQRDVSCAVHSWAVEQASSYADEEEFANYILPRCTEEELEQVFTNMVSRGVWEPADNTTGSDVSIAQHILSRLIFHGLWFAVAFVLNHDISSAVHRWAVEEVSRHADEPYFVALILPHCSDEELESVLSHLASRGMWQSVGAVLERDISPTQHSWAVEEALKHAGEFDFVQYILPPCRDEELESVLPHLVSQGWWKSVGGTLKKSVKPTQHREAVEESSRHAADDDFILYILLHCLDEELESVLFHLVSRGLWKSLCKVLERDITHTQHSWVVEEASRHAPDTDFVKYILPRCFDKELESVLTHLVSRGMGRSVSGVLERGVSFAQHRSALVAATKHVDDLLYHFCLLRHSEDDIVAVFPHLVTNKKVSCMEHAMWLIVRDILCTWIISEHDSTTHATLFWQFICHNYHIQRSLALSVTKALTTHITLRGYIFCKCCIDFSYNLAGRVSWEKNLCASLLTTLSITMWDLMCSGGVQYEDSTELTWQCVSDIYTQIIACVKDNRECIQDETLTAILNKDKWMAVFTELADSHSNDRLFLLHFLQGLNLYHTSRRGENDDTVLLVMLAVFPLFPQLQSVALRIMLREKRWDVLSQACLSHVWEHDRRRLFKAAVMQRQWDVVRQWCDHTVHDDQRHWALTEAFEEKQWEVYLLLADHGLTVDEQMYAHYRVAKYGHWATVLNMVDRGGDITEVSNLLEKWVMRYLRKKPEGDVTVYEQRCMKLIRLRLRFARKSALSPRKALERCLWGSVLFKILHKPTKRFFSEVLEKVLEEQQWHVLMHLVRLGMTSADRDRLFPDMVRQQQWGVCRQLLEHGVDDHLCLEALPELMEKNQWMLVARVMEHDVDDAVRRQVLLWAFQRRAGALFWHCINLLEDQKPLSTAVKEQFFHLAIRRGIWQAVKPLVKEKDVRHLVKEDGPDIQRRDLAFLEAIEQHLWDVVDYCQRLGADINMKDDNGETPLNREARKREWKAVEEIVCRDGYPNHLDKDGVSVMNRLIDNEQWDIVKVVIKYGGDIHLSARYNEQEGITLTHSPLQALISARQADVIHSTIKWCGGQDWGVNDKGERVLHAVCDSDRWDVMRDLTDIKVNPLVLTNTGKSPLAYAVLNTKCGQRMVAECSRQGFSFHQPSLTGPQDSLLQDVNHALVGFSMDWFDRPSLFDYIRWKSNITSPLVCAVLCDLPVVAFMLYESGSCSNTELFTLHTQLPKLTDPNTEEGRALHEEIDRNVQDTISEIQGDTDGSRVLWSIIFKADDVMQRFSQLTHSLQEATAFLRELATTPRPLLSSCRLKILQSPCFHFSHKHREKAMGYDYLNLPESLEEYLRFSDLCDPDYGGHMK